MNVSPLTSKYFDIHNSLNGSAQCFYFFQKEQGVQKNGNPVRTIKQRQSILVGNFGLAAANTSAISTAS